MSIQTLLSALFAQARGKSLSTSHRAGSLPIYLVPWLRICYLPRNRSLPSNKFRISLREAPCVTPPTSLAREDLYRETPLTSSYLLRIRKRRQQHSIRHTLSARRSALRVWPHRGKEGLPTFCRSAPLLTLRRIAYDASGWACEG